MASSVSRPPPAAATPCLRGGSCVVSLSFSPLMLYFRRSNTVAMSLCARAVRTEPDGWRIEKAESYAPDLLRRPRIEEEEEEDGGDEGDVEEFVDWEDRILEDTVPLVGLVRMILHSGKYESGDRLRPEHERTIVDRLLPYHPAFEKKIGSGIDYITVGHHPDFESSRCLFIVRKDGELVDFSYWKCIKGLIRKNYPLYADSFILRHFRRRRQNR